MTTNETTLQLIKDIDSKMTTIESICKTKFKAEVAGLTTLIDCLDGVDLEASNPLHSLADVKVKDVDLELKSLAIDVTDDRVNNFKIYYYQSNEFNNSDFDIRIVISENISESKKNITIAIPSNTLEDQFIICENRISQLGIDFKILISEKRSDSQYVTITPFKDIHSLSNRSTKLDNNCYICSASYTDSDMEMKIESKYGRAKKIIDIKLKVAS